MRVQRPLHNFNIQKTTTIRIVLVASSFTNAQNALVLRGLIIFRYSAEL